MKQTAVEWLEEKFKNSHANFINWSLENFEQAKEMEKQQIIEAGNSCALRQYLHNDRVNKMTESEIRQFAEEKHLTFGEQYYKETFNK